MADGLRLYVKTLETRLAPYACRSANSKRREAEEPSTDLRTPYQRDRDRIIHSRAFRRLAHKTQVFALGVNDHVRTRLTHSLEVGQTARAIGRLLGLNEDLIAAVALGHDLGHAPFGHSGEAALNECLEACPHKAECAWGQDCVGFAHNVQGLRVVDTLEDPSSGRASQDFTIKAKPTDGQDKIRDRARGLNLTQEVREGILKHKDIPLGYRDVCQSLHPDRPGTLEAQVVRMADRIAFTCSDFEDAYRAEVFGEMRESGLVTDRLLEQWVERFVPASGRGYSSLLNALVLDVVRTTFRLIKKHKVQTPEDARRLSRPIVTMSPRFADKFDLLHEWVSEHVSFGPKASANHSGGVRVVRRLFGELLHRPRVMPLKTWLKFKTAAEYFDEDSGLPPHAVGNEPVDFLPLCRLRVIADHISGMTDRYALELHDRLRL